MSMLSSRPRLRSILLSRWAAAVIGIIVIPLLLFRSLHHPTPKPTSILPSTIATVQPLPGDRCITLPDGTKVLLHQLAQLDFRTGFTAARREVTLHGEAFFDIHRDTRPFVVHTGAVRTTVLGTAFNIDANNQRRIVITVTKGKVKVENGRGGVSILRRNEQLSVDSARLQKTKVDAQIALTWKKTYWLFNDVPLHEAMDELAQRYHLSVIYTNPAAANCPVTASFTAGESVEAIIEVLAKINNMDYTIDHGRVTITGEGCR
jgi:ferric-dicitrate binding protein FerR (iron transport regulator)